MRALNVTSLLKAAIRRKRRGIRIDEPNKKANDASIKAYVSDLLRSHHFDAEYYSQKSGIAFETAAFAAEHYLSSGEAIGIKPSLTFDPVGYLEANEDLRALPYPLIVHYIKHGEGEQRPVPLADLDGNLLPGRKHFDAGKETAIVVVHEMSRTGAPILGLNLVQELSRQMNVVVISNRSGELLENFLKDAVCVAVPPVGRFRSDAQALCRGVISPLVEKFGAKFAIVNSVEVAVFAPACQLAGLPCISLIHEFADQVFPKSKIYDVIFNSQRVVFSSRLTQETFCEHEDLDGPVVNTCVIPQGKCNPPEVASEHRRPGLIEAVRTDPRPLVIGCGYVQPRKGVDFFIAAATSVTKKLGKNAVRFVWVGAGYQPDKDEYSRWLKSQIERSDLDGSFEFANELGMSDLSSLYDAATVMFLSSRLDPFPNVAIDAIHAGLPIVSFEKASGVAECFSNIELLKDMVVGHMDVGGASEQIIALIRDPKRRDAVSQSLRRLAKEQFVFEDYVDKLLAQVREPGAN